MPDREPLSEAEIQDALARLDGWTFENDAIHKTYEFDDFREAISFIVQMAFYAEEANHHPELENVYNSVTLSFTTHDAGSKVTDMDIELARTIDDALGA
ncbi:4a-hydroxytetrahydrobiopterin dehydratase [Longibacter salinarum]|uniref:Putative pterin-4-alpha-carbinolamine dehydratase n=1 Tax=Longibacter salinarum TaxID=1850348 RepID=A0A2A8D1X7_9BACT|nr:4a-hydroxytetrahydrobiopterin dehydratase [Longibacter salinarum]PEN14890.1 4a-hydroxytetrahydrobiopterin dehydratase [Longibacter salinarum]